MTVTFDYVDYNTDLNYYADGTFGAISIVIEDYFKFSGSFNYDGSAVAGLFPSSNTLSGDYVLYERYSGAPTGSPDTTTPSYDTFDFQIPPNWSAVAVDLSGSATMPSPPGGTVVFTYYAYDVRLYADGIFVGDMRVEGRISGDISPVCFTGGSIVETSEGPVPIEALRVGDMVNTRDHGPQPVRWIGASHYSAEMLNQFPGFRPITIAAGALGDHSATAVSPHHRICVADWRAEALFGTEEVLVAARDLCNDTTIRPAEDGDVTYYHILFDAHEIITIDGLASESFHPNAIGRGSVGAQQRDEVLALFPELEVPGRWQLARRPLATPEAAVIISGL